MSQQRGNRVRIRLSNRYRDRPLHVTETGGIGATVVAGTIRPLTFRGRRSTTIAAGAVVASDGTTTDAPV